MNKVLLLTLLLQRGSERVRNKDIEETCRGKMQAQREQGAEREGETDRERETDRDRGRERKSHLL